MIAVLTGDIINSQKVNPSEWMKVLKNVLRHYGKEPKQWEIYRGDSFQLKVDLEDALTAAIHIKAYIKQIKPLDVRVGIGLGDINYDSHRITESNGAAFVRSGEIFESMGKQTLGIKSGQETFDDKFNHFLALITFIMNNWTPVSAEAMKIAIEHPDKTQKEMAAIVNKSQSNLSEIFSRAGRDEIMKTIAYYKKNLKLSENDA
ncbi:MAG: SatD family protein [Cyclobacteriaceae bacterium]|nr:transcriptional regulator [Cyclobacteriaceae bacterium]MCH8515689.1 SatD family protein [Cyclobacteriaceae bacterium]